MEIKLLNELAGVFFLAASVSMILTARIFERSKKLLPFGATAAMPNRIQSYTDASEISAAIWLILGCILGIAIATQDGYLVRDVFIHVVAIGFVGSTIIGYAPVLLPGVLTSRGPREKLSLWPLLLLDAGLAVRVAGNSYAIAMGSSLPLWESLSGILIILSMVSFGYFLHSRRTSIALK